VLKEGTPPSWAPGVADETLGLVYMPLGTTSPDIWGGNRTPNQTIREAARLMSEEDIGVLPVAETDRLIGMITDRDIAIRAVAEGKGPEASVRDVMTNQVKYCFEDDDLDDVSRNIANIQMRRLPVMRHDKRLVGIVSLGDLATETQARRQAQQALSGVVSQPSHH
jgi:predicted transcriptional regulator